MKGLDGNSSVEKENGETVKGFFKDGLRHGLCNITSSRTNVEEIEGVYRGGKLEGEARVKFWDRTMIIDYFKAGILHGFAWHFDKKGRPMRMGSLMEPVRR